MKYSSEVKSTPVLTPCMPAIEAPAALKPIPAIAVPANGISNSLDLAAEEYRRNQLPNETRKQRHRIVSQLIQRRIKSHEVGRAENLQRPAVRSHLGPGEHAP